MPWARLGPRLPVFSLLFSFSFVDKCGHITPWGQGQWTGGVLSRVQMPSSPLSGGKTEMTEPPGEPQRPLWTRTAHFCALRGKSTSVLFIKPLHLQVSLLQQHSLDPTNLATYCLCNRGQVISLSFLLREMES